MFLYLLLLLTLVPILELALLFKIAGAIDWVPTIGLVLVTGAVGAALARSEGLKTLAQIQADLNAGKMPAAAMVEGVLILAAGLVLITPGVMTDALGLFLLIPPCRRWVARILSDKFRGQFIIMHQGGVPGEQSGDDEFIDVEVTNVSAEGTGRTHQLSDDNETTGGRS